MKRALLFTACLSGILLLAGVPAAAQPTPEWQPLCDTPDNPAARPAPWNKFAKLTLTQRCTACTNLPGNHAAACNPNNWDCAASTIFAPADGSACAFGPGGTCNCPLPPAGQKKMPVRKPLPK
jgi:hypothetical protein